MLKKFLNKIARGDKLRNAALQKQIKLTTFKSTNSFLSKNKIEKM